jgi:hypothetical protein
LASAVSFAGVTGALSADAGGDAAAPAWNTNNPWGELSTGVYYSQPSAEPVGYGGWASFLFSPQGDIWADGLLLKLDSGAGRYLYTSGIFVDAPVTYYSAAALVGYRQSIGESSVLQLFVGPDFNFTDHPDPTATPRGAEWGVKGALDFTVPIADPVFFDFNGSISSIRTQYMAQGRIRVKASRETSLGPEIAAQGSDNYQLYRAGAFAAMATEWGGVGGSAGYMWDRDFNPIGLYAGIGVTVDFR